MANVFYSSPEAFAQNSSLDEALSYYGLTRERMSAEIIRWLESVRLEDPRMYDYLVIPKLGSEMYLYVDKWDFVFSTGLTTDAPARRGWDDFMALREFIQNSLDVEEKLYGYDNIRVNVFTDSLGTHIVDRGTGIDIDMFKIGGSDKGCADRGYFGEGLKYALAHFVSKGYWVYIFTRKGVVYKALTVPRSNLVLIVLGRSNRFCEGTEVIIEFYTLTASPENIVFHSFMESNKDKFYVLTRKDYGTCECYVSKPNFIIASHYGEADVDMLWVRDIYVNKISNMLKKSIFGYNLWWVPLEPNRKMVSEMHVLLKEAAKVFDTNSILMLLDKVVEYDNILQCYKIKEGYFETSNIDWYYSDTNLFDVVAEWVKIKGLAITTNTNVIDWIKYMGVQPLVIPDSMSSLFRNAPTCEWAVAEKARLRAISAHETQVLEKDLPFYPHLINFGLINLLIQAYCYINSKNPVSVIVSKSMGESVVAQMNSETRTMYILYDYLRMPKYRIMSVCIHELAHLHASETLGYGADLTEGFETALSNVGSDMLYLSTQNNEFVKALKRCMNGAWNTKFAYFKDGKWSQAPSLSTKLEKLISAEIPYQEIFSYQDRIEIDERAPPYIFLIRPDRIKLPYITILNVLECMQAPVDKEIYYRAMDNHITKYNRPSEYYGKGKVVIFVYDPWEDTYVKWREV